MPRQLQKCSLEPHNSIGVGPGGQGVEPLVGAFENKALDIDVIKFRLG
jgi:hypothetical protein